MIAGPDDHVPSVGRFPDLAARPSAHGHVNVPVSPTTEWTAQQIVEAFPYEEAPRFILRDRDAIYEEAFRRRVRHMGIEEVVTAYRSPWQNPYVERLIGSIRRECLDHVIVLSEAHLRGILACRRCAWVKRGTICAGELPGTGRATSAQVHCRRARLPVDRSSRPSVG